MPGRNVLAAFWANILITLLSFALLTWTFEAGRQLEMDTSLSRLSWARAQFSTALAISRVEYGAPGYLILHRVWGLMVTGGFTTDAGSQVLNPNRGIANALGQQIVVTPGPGQTHADLYMRDWGDDKGAADFYIIAFKLFGFKVQSLYYLYFLLLTVSVTAFIIQFFRTIAYLLFVPFYLAAHHLAVLTLPDSLVSSVVHDARFQPAVACLSALHIALLLVRGERSTLAGALRTVPALLVHVAIIVLVIDSRPSAIWLVYFPIGTFIVSVLWALWRERRFASVSMTVVSRAYIVAVLVAGPLLLSVYKDLAFDRAYTVDGIQGHMVWHSIYMGLSVHPDARQHGITYTDSVSYRAGYMYLSSHPALAEQLGVNLNELPFEPQDTEKWIRAGVGFRVYEQIAKANVLSFVAEHPLFVMQSVLFYKPAYIVQQLLWQAGLTDHWPNWVGIEPSHGPATRHTLNLLSFPAAAVVGLSVIAAFLSGIRGSGLWPGLACLLFLASLLPSIAVAPIYYELQVVWVTWALAAYAIGVSILVATLSLLADLRAREKVPSGRVRATVVVTMVGLAVVGIELWLLAGGSSEPGTVEMPGKLPWELAKDSLGEVWIITPDGARRQLPDWGTYLQYGGDPTFQALRRLSDDELATIRMLGVAPSTVSQPTAFTEPAPGTRLPLSPGVTIGQAPRPAESQNAALNRSARQSDGSASAMAAVDGDTTGAGRNRSVAFVADERPGIEAEQRTVWWQVDLGGRQPISDIEIWPQTNPCCLDRLHNFLVFISDDDFASDDPQVLRGQPEVTSYYVLGRAGVPTTIDVRRPGRYVRVQMMRASYMELAEVQVWSDPSVAAAPR